MTAFCLERQVLHRLSTRLKEVSEEVGRDLILDLLQIPPTLDIRNERPSEHLIGAENLEEVSFLAIKGDHGQGESSTLSILHGGAVNHHEPEPVVHDESAIFRRNDLVVV